MRYRGKDIEMIGEKMVFGKRTAWIRLVEGNSFQQVLWDDIVFDDEHHQDISHIRYIALATRIKEEYVRTSFNKAKQNRNTALALVMTMLQKIASSSTAAIYSALSTRLYQLQNGLEDSVKDYDPEYDTSDFDGFQPSDYSVTYSSDSRSEEEVLQDLVEEASVCMEQEQDAKAEALIRTIAQQRMEQGDPRMKVLVFTEFRATQQYLEKQLTAKGLLCLTQQILFTLYGVRQQVASSIYSITRIIFCTMPLT